MDEFELEGGGSGTERNVHDDRTEQDEFGWMDEMGSEMGRETRGTSHFN